MAELREGYQAIFYSGPKRISASQTKKTYEDAEREIDRANELYDTFHYTPWTHAKVEKIHYRH